MALQAFDILTTLSAIPTALALVHDNQTQIVVPQKTLIGLPQAEYLWFFKLCVLLVLLVNAGSLPFAWHLHVFWPVIVFRIPFYLLRAILLFRSPAERKRILAERIEALCPIGANPFEFGTVHRRWASIDDTDMFGFHLSNSSYAKALDSAYLRISWKAFPAWTEGAGGTVALGATYYQFIREISLFARYEIRISIASWDNKWMYYIARFVTNPKGHHTINAATTTSSEHSPISSGSPAATDTNTNTSPLLNGSSILNNTAVNSDYLGKLLTDLLAGAPSRRPVLEPDGSLLHCIAISQVCFKKDRISVPPAVVLASEGFSNPPCVLESNGSHSLPPQYTPSNPPPHWAKVREIRVPPSGSVKHFREFLKRGWKEVPGYDGQAENMDRGKTGRWWEEALGGPIEEKRKRNLKIVEALRVGMVGVRESYHSLEGCEMVVS